jgi:hypothetical protein
MRSGVAATRRWFSFMEISRVACGSSSSDSGSDGYQARSRPDAADSQRQCCERRRCSSARNIVSRSLAQLEQ